MVNGEHERIEELLAGYALLALSGEDAIEADRLLSEHVPSCPMCRDTLAGFQSVAGELALAPSPVAPPELMLPRLRRQLEHVSGRRRRATLVAAAAGGIALVTLSGLSMSLASRASKAEHAKVQLSDFVGTLQQPGASSVSLTSMDRSSPGMVEVSGPGFERMYIVGRDVPEPAPGHAYQLWLGSGGTFVPVGDMFLPEDGLVYIRLTFDPRPYDEILITEEAIGSRMSAPSRDGHVWHASLTGAA